MTAPTNWSDNPADPAHRQVNAAKLNALGVVINNNAPAVATHAANSKSVPVSADELPIVDSAASNVLKKVTFANLKAAVTSDAVKAVKVVTGSEARPSTTGLVLWIGGTSAPANFDNTKDVWLAIG